MGDGEITRDIASIALNRLEVDSLGLDSLDKRMLTMLIKGTTAVRQDWKRWRPLSEKKQ